MFEILEYITEDGKKPFAIWLLNLKDKKAQVKIRARIVGNKIVLLLAGSTKKDQNSTIAKAKEYLADYERRMNDG